MQNFEENIVFKEFKKMNLRKIYPNELSLDWNENTMFNSKLTKEEKIKTKKIFNFYKYFSILIFFVSALLLSFVCFTSFPIFATLIILNVGYFWILRSDFLNTCKQCIEDKKLNLELIAIPLCIFFTISIILPILILLVANYRVVIDKKIELNKKIMILKVTANNQRYLCDSTNKIHNNEYEPAYYITNSYSIKYYKGKMYTSFEHFETLKKEYEKIKLLEKVSNF